MSKSTPELLALQTALAGRYSLERELGRGGMGIVFLAREVTLDRPVALKLLPPELAAREDVRSRFLQEARTAAKLSHPNIVPIIAVDEVDGFVFFVMAYIDGETLGERVRGRGPLSESDASRLVREVAWALSYAHLQGVVHRDVKPDNILIERETGRALVTDFGIALSGVDVEGHRPEEILGTAEFMSPEQATGAPVDARSDLYSLGVVAFYAVSGRLPFEASTSTALLAKHVAEPSPPVASRAPGVSASLARAIDRCLRKEPEKRYADGSALVEALSESVAVARALPVPLRVFINRLREMSQSSAAGAAFLVLFGTPMVVSAIAVSRISGFAALAAVAGGVAALTLGNVTYHVRKLLKAGHTRDDALAALREDVARRNEEFRFDVGPRVTRLDRILKMLTYGTLGTAGVSLITLRMMMPTAPGWLWGVATTSAMFGALTGLLAASRSRRRGDVVGERWLKRLKGRLGEWVFKLAGLGLRKRELGAGVHRPTEMAIGYAAARLFEELPKETRKSLAGLPDTVQKLESDARVLRGQVSELNAVLAELGDDPAAPGAEERERVHAEVLATRDDAEARLRAAVTSLEKIRVGLLRIHAGDAPVQSVTVELQGAEELAREMAGLLEGHREVERLLSGRRATGRITLPRSPLSTPAPASSSGPHS